ncbi:uncharacterized protein DNG_05215 [Cephalotrichum gorgonifer]|uniref:AAA+ ATPase domain-containing protein n=1 Tax=Cephalotrichum gorgonifer TaxID=2041049 RepID=A0AAE8MXY1_9PEZI|nr:uncharacterized protein DNG_05215 [Cephalotrichum gorgonifer]
MEFQIQPYKEPDAASLESVEDSAEDYPITENGASREDGGKNENEKKGDDEDGEDGEDEDGHGKALRCVVKEFESRVNAKGETVRKELSPSKSDADTPDGEKQESDAAIEFCNYFVKGGAQSRSTLKIYAHSIQVALREVIKSYPRQSFDGSVVTLTGSSEADCLACVFHYRSSLMKYSEGLKAEDKLDVYLLIQFIGRKFDEQLRYLGGSDVECYDTNIHVAYRDMWTIFKPGGFLVTTQCEENCIVQLEDIHHVDGGIFSESSWHIKTRAVAHDGTKFGYIRKKITITQYSGVRQVSSLPIYPLGFDKNPEEVRTSAIQRGQKYCRLTNSQLHQYTGTAFTLRQESTYSISRGSDVVFRLDPRKVVGRVILDPASFEEFNPRQGITLTKVNPEPKFDAVTEEEYQIFDNRISGFALQEKKWMWFLVSNITDVQFNQEAFDKVILPGNQKSLLKAIANQHTKSSSISDPLSSSRDHFDDFISGKGKGCIILLHGDPGLGKTVTVESIAENIKRPLYVVMSGELGSTIDKIEENLNQVLGLATRWNAVLLIDEADIFLEMRSSHQLNQNHMVSVFLRSLEYFQGMMFLTTNRMKSFDPAFQSRIHLVIEYKSLEIEAKRRLWIEFLQKIPDYNAKEWSEDDLESLAKLDLNGRQIKNAVRIANCLALDLEEKLAPKDIRTYIRQNSDTIATQQDIYNRIADSRRELCEGQSTIHALANQLDNEGFWNRMQFDQDGRVTAVLFAHPESLAYLQAYPDLLFLDCTYKTNKYGMPLLDMIGVDACQRSFCIAFAFLSGETEEDYIWALDRLRPMYELCGTRLPSVILTDRCIACMNAVSYSFPSAISLLCLWHANKAVLRYCRPSFVRDQYRSENQQDLSDWKEFFGHWHSIIRSSDEEVFSQHVQQFERRYLPQNVNEVEYIKTTWLDIYKEKLVKAWVDQHLHFGNVVTSRVEGIHGLLKSHLKRSTLDLFEAWRAMKQALLNQLAELRYNQAKQQTRIPIELSGSLYSANKVRPFN